MTTAPRLEIVDAGILFINPDPSRYHVFASHAHPVQRSATEFVATYQRGAALYATDLQIAFTRSLDGGVTWSDEGPIYDRSRDERPYSYHDGFLSQTRDGALHVLAFRIDRTDPDRPMFSPGGGIIDLEMVRFSSTDGGRSWSLPQPVRLPSGFHATPSNPIVELPNGDWLALLDQWHGQDEPGPYRPRMIAMTSSDRGATWSEPYTFVDGNADRIGFWHGKAILLRDGRLYSTFWTADMSDERIGAVDLPIHQAFTRASERRSAHPRSTGLPGQTHWPAELPGGELAIVSTRRLCEQPGFTVALSTDGGQTWDPERQLRLWDTTGWTNLGVHVPDVYPHSHDTVAFGAPTLMTTEQGELYASWWCTYASITHIRWAKLRLTS